LNFYVWWNIKILLPHGMTESHVTIVQDRYVVDASDDRCIGNLWKSGEVWSAWKRTCPIATVSNGNGTWTTMGLNYGFYGAKLVTNHLSFEASQWG